MAAVLFTMGMLGRLPASIVMPRGAVIAFDARGCPDNGAWEQLDSVAGRVVVGAGAADGLTPRKYGDTGGYERLSVDHIPRHSHTLSVFHGDDGTGGGGAVQVGDADANKIRANALNTSSVGAAEPLQSMPPFLVLTYCVKR